jgi:D-alanine-D-alanine ligase
MKTRVGIVFGGRSGEHEISIRSAKTVLEQIDREKYDPVPLMIDPNGNWLNPKRSLSAFPRSTQDAIGALENLTGGTVALLPNAMRPEITLLPAEGADRLSLDIDVIFPVLHGTFGEDGTIQGLFEMLGIPYVGCGVLASSCGMDKAVMKVLFKDASLPICRYVWFLRNDWESSADRITAHVESEIGYPCFVKPSNLGSSVGVAKAVDSSSLRAAVDDAATYDRKIIIEEGLEVREIECAVIGNDSPRASLPGEYLIRDKEKAFLDYTEKYTGTGNNEFVVPAPISDELTEMVRSMAVRAFKAIDGSGLARVDFFLRRDNGSLLLIEINTMPGLTDASGFPKMWAGSGQNFSSVISELIEFAVTRHEDRKRNRTTFEPA